MRDPFPVKVTRRAEREIKRAEKWWRENREAATEALREELENAFDLIAAQPHIGARATNAKLPGVRRIHLSRVHYSLLPAASRQDRGRSPGVVAHQAWTKSTRLD